MALNAALACLISAAPASSRGSATFSSAGVTADRLAELAPDRSLLLLHVFDEAGDAEFIDRFKTRYEQPLKEIFESD